MVAITPKWALPVEETGDPSDMPAASGRLTQAIEKALDRVQQAAADLIAQSVAGRVSKGGDAMSGTLQINTAVGTDATLWMNNGADTGWTARVESGTDDWLLGKAGPSGAWYIRMYKSGAMDLWAPTSFKAGVNIAATPQTNAPAIGPNPDSWFWVVTDAGGTMHRLTNLMFRTAVVAASGQSTARSKTGVADPDTIPDVAGLRPRTFRWTDKAYAPVYPGERLGLVAEEVAQVDPRLVTRDGDGDVLGLDVPAVLAVLVAKVNSLQTQLDQMKAGS